MTVTMELTPELEAQLRNAAARGDADTMRRLLAEAAAPVVEALLQASAATQAPPALLEPNTGTPKDEATPRAAGIDIEALLQDPDRELTMEEFEALADHLADLVEAARGPNAPPLSDYAVSREGIYQDHP